MFREDAGRVLHRHVVAGERHHAGAGGEVRGVERRAEQGFGGGGLAIGSSDARQAGRKSPFAPPLSR
jgi:hypothetical protein